MNPESQANWNIPRPLHLLPPPETNPFLLRITASPDSVCLYLLHLHVGVIASSHEVR